MTKITRKNWGFSLVELVLGSALLLVMMAAFMFGFQTLTKGNTSLALKSKVDFKLRSVAESIRFSAGANFDSMTETDADRTGDDKRIKITSTITPIDDLQQYRTATLTANWFEGGQARTKTFSFTFRRIRGKFSGTKLRLRVMTENTNPSVGVGDITVAAPGQDSPMIIGTTDSEGYVTLNGVLSSDKGIYFNVDGQSRRHYFDNPVASFQKTFQSAPTWGGDMTDMSANPTLIKAPVKIRGKVMIDGTSTPIQNQQLDLFTCKPLIPYDGHESVTTKPNGEYSFEVIPGYYWVYLIGSKDYAGLGRKGDYHWVGEPGDADPRYNPPILFQVDPTHNGTDFVKDYYTLPRSTITATVRSVQWDSASENFIPFGVVANQSLRVVANGTNLYSASGVNSLFWNFTTWTDFWGSSTFMGTSDFSFPVTTDGYGQFTLNKVGPAVLNEADPLASQFIIYDAAPRQVGNEFPTKSPTLPVTVSMINGKAEFIYYTRYGTFNSQSSYSGPSTSSVQNYLYPNTNATPTFSYLDANALATVNFKFYKDAVAAGNNIGFDPMYCYSANNVYQTTNPDASGNILLTRGWNSGGSISTHNTSLSVQRIIPSPNGDEPLTFSFFGWTGSGWSTNPQILNVTGYEKALVAGVVVYRVVPKEDMDINGVVVHSEYINAPTWHDAGWQTINIVDGKGVTAPVTDLVGWNASTSTTVYVRPGSTVNLDIVLSGFSKGYNHGRVTIDPTASWFQQPYYKPLTVSYSSTDSALVGYVNLQRVGNTPRIYGTVCDTAGVVIPNATVTLWRSGENTNVASVAPYLDLTMMTAADVYGDGSNYQFAFSDVKSVHWGVNNLKLTVSAAGYDTVTDSTDKADGMDWNRNFTLIKNISAVARKGNL